MNEIEGFRSSNIVPIRSRSAQVEALAAEWLDGYAVDGTRYVNGQRIHAALAAIRPATPDDFSEAAVAKWAIVPGDSNSTIRGRITAVRSFLTWAYEHGHCDRPPTFRRLLRSFPTTAGKTSPKGFPARWLTYEEAFSTMAGACDETDTGLRDELVIRLGLLGMRSSEIRTATLAGLSLSAPSLTFMGKGRKAATLPLPARLVELLTEWVRRYPQEHQSESSPLLCPNGRGGLQNNAIAWGTQMCVSSVGRIVKRCAERVHLGHVAPHDLRRSAAAILHNTVTPEGAHHYDLHDVQRTLRHADPATTMKHYMDPLDGEKAVRRAVHALD
jgi:integrase/recombinase XerC